MTRLERYKEKVKDLEWRRNQFMRQGRYDKMRQLEHDIEEVRVLIAQAEEFEAKPIKELMTSEQITESNLIPLIIEAHLASDFLTDCCYNIQDTINRMGFSAVTIIPELIELRKKADEFAAKLAGKNPMLDDMLIDDETMIEGMHKRLLKYIEQRMTPRDTKRKRDANGRFAKISQ